MKKTSLATLLGIFSSLAFAGNTNVVGYYPNWASYGADFQPKHISKNVDEIVYAFFQVGQCATPGDHQLDDPELCIRDESKQMSGIQDFKLHSTDPYADFVKMPSDYLLTPEQKDWPYGKGLLKDTLALGKPVTISVGGWSLSAAIFKLLESEANINTFVQSVVDYFEYIRQDTGYGLAGIDIDWEPNHNSWSFTRDMPIGQANQILSNYILLMSKLKTELTKAAGYEIKVGIAGPAGESAIRGAESAYPGFWSEMGQSIDEFNLMSYDYYGTWGDPVTNFNAPLYGQAGTHTQLNVHDTVDLYLVYNMPAYKVNLGIPAYGRTYANVNAGNSAIPGLHQTYSGSAVDATLTYKEIMMGKGLYGQYNFVTTQDWAHGQATGYDANQKVFVTYDNAASVANKVSSQIDAKGLRGAMFWDVTGDFKNTDPQYATLSLINSVK